MLILSKIFIISILILNVLFIFFFVYIQLIELYLCYINISLDNVLTDQFFNLELPFLYPKALNNKERNAIELPNYNRDILIGLILGDIHGRRKSLKKKVATFVFKQSIIHQDYLYHLYDLFKDLSPGIPRLHNHSDKRTEKIYSYLTFNTYSAPCFNELYNLFYKNKIKVIHTIIVELLKPVSLAYWICDDGSYNKVGKYLTLCTDSFQLEEIELLIEVLNKNFNFNCYKLKSGKNHRIIIPTKNLPDLI